MARLYVLLAALLFSTGGAAIKAVSLDGFQVACLRSAFAAVALALLLPASRRGWGRPRTWLVAASYAATLILFVTSTKLTTAANAIFLQSTAPLWILVLGPWLLAERLRPRDLWYMAVVATGLAALFLGSPRASVTAPDPATGNILATVAGLTWALTVSGLRWLERSGERGGLPAAALGNVVACLAALPFAAPFPPPLPVDWLTLAFLGLVQIAVAYAFLTAGLTRVPALEASLLLLVEPVLNPVWTWLVHGEDPGSWPIAGGALVLCATAVKAVVGEKKPPMDTDEHR